MKSVIKQLMTIIMCFGFYYGQAQTLSKKEADDTKDMQDAITNIVKASLENFAHGKGDIMSQDKQNIHYQAKPILLGLYDSFHFISENKTTQKWMYDGFYQNIITGTLAFNAFTNMPFHGKQWSIKTINSTDNNYSEALLLFNDVKVGRVTKDIKKYETEIQIGQF